MTNPTIIGTLTSIKLKDSVYVTIPAATPAGSSYIIKITGTSPAITSNQSDFITIAPPPSAGTALAKNVCTGNTINLQTTGSTNNKYKWTGPNGFLSYSYKPAISNATVNNSGVYSVRVQYLGCEGPESSTTITVSSLIAPHKPKIITNSSVCTGDTLKLTANISETGNYVWSVPYWYRSIGNTNSATIPDITTSDSGVYTLFISTKTCNSDIDTAKVQVKVTPVLNDAFLNDNIDILCAGEPIILRSEDIGAEKYEWTGPANFNASGMSVKIPSATMEMAGKYFLKATKNGCTSNPFETIEVGILNENPLTAQTPDWETAKFFPEISGAFYHRITKADSHGNIFTMGEASNKSIFSANDSTPANGNLVVIVKMNVDGKIKWVKSFTGTGSTYGGGLTLGKDGNIFISGQFSGTSVQIGNYNLNRKGTAGNFFFARLDSLGNAVWARQGSCDDKFFINIPIAVDDNGNSYITAGYNYNSNIEGVTLQGRGVFMARYSSDGTFQWAKKITGTGDYQAYELRIFNNQYLYAVSDFNWNLSLSKFDLNGNLIWERNYTSYRAGNNNVFRDAGSDILFDSKGNIYMSGLYFENGRFRASYIINPLHYVALFKLDQDGNVVWRKLINEKTDFNGTDKVDLGIDGKDNIYISGNMSGNFSCSFVSTGSSYIAQYSDAGILNWVKSVPVPLWQPIVTRDGTICSIAQIGTEANFGNGLILKNKRSSSSDAVFLKLGKVRNSINILPQSICAGEKISIPFKADNLNYSNDNVFKVELSDQNGEFTNPMVIDSFNSSDLKLINTRIPMAIKEGKNYRIRISSTSPQNTGTDNGAPITIKLPVINLGNVNNPVCAGSEIKIPVTFTGNCGFYEGNIFTVELSNLDGDFGFPTILHQFTSINSDSIPLTIPDSLSYGKNYRIRLVTTLPVVISPVNTLPVTILGRPVISHSRTTYYCERTTLNFSSNQISGATYSWKGPANFNSSDLYPSIKNLGKENEGQYSLSYKVASCLSKPSYVNIKVEETSIQENVKFRWVKDSLNKATDAIIKLTDGSVLTAFNNDSQFVHQGGTIEKGIVFARYDTSGNLISIRNVCQGEKMISLISIRQGKDNSIYLNGLFQGMAKIGIKTLTPNGLIDAFIAKYTTEGENLWVCQIGANEVYLTYNPEGIYPLQFDSKDNLIVAGYFAPEGSPTSNWIDNSGGKTEKHLTSNATKQNYMARISPSGYFLERKTFDRIVFTHFLVDEQDNYFFSRAFYDTVSIGKVKLNSYNFSQGRTSNFLSEIYIAKTDPQLNVLWAKKISTDNDVYTLEFERSYSDKSVILAFRAGYGDVYFEDGINRNGIFNKGDDVICKISDNGEFQWTKNISYSITDLDVDNEGGVYISTYHTGGMNTIFTGCNSVTGSLSRAAFIVKYDKDGIVKFIKPASSDNQSTTGVQFHKINVQTPGAIYTTGLYFKEAMFDNISFKTSSSYFFAKLENEPNDIITDFSPESSAERDNSVLVYPNPTQDNLKVIINQIDPVSLRVFNNLGQNIIQQKVGKEREVMLKTDGFTHGLYFLEIDFGTTKKIVKFIKE